PGAWNRDVFQVTPTRSPRSSSSSSSAGDSECAPAVVPRALTRTSTAMAAVRTELIRALPPGRRPGRRTSRAARHAVPRGGPRVALREAVRPHAIAPSRAVASGAAPSPRPSRGGGRTASAPDRPTSRARAREPPERTPVRRAASVPVSTALVDDRPPRKRRRAVPLARAGSPRPAGGRAARARRTRRLVRAYPSRETRAIGSREPAPGTRRGADPDRRAARRRREWARPPSA